MVTSAEQEPCDDARTTRTGRYSAWLKKAKSDDAKLKWINKSTTRYFTIDFDNQIFYYSHSEKAKSLSHLTHFRDILSAERLPAKITSKRNTKHNSGFVVRTRDRNYELFSGSNADAAQWVYALNAGRENAKLGGDGDAAAAHPVASHEAEAGQHVGAQRKDHSFAVTEDAPGSGERAAAPAPMNALPPSPSPMPPTALLATELAEESPEAALERMYSSLNEERLERDAAKANEEGGGPPNATDEQQAHEVAEAARNAKEERLAHEAAGAVGKREDKPSAQEDECLAGEAAQAARAAEEERMAGEVAQAAQRAEEERLAREAAEVAVAEKANEERKAREAAEAAARNAEEERRARQAVEAAARNAEEEERRAREAAEADARSAEEEERKAREAAEAAARNAEEEERRAREAAEADARNAEEEERRAREAAEAAARNAEEERKAREAAEAAARSAEEERKAREAAEAAAPKVEEECEARDAAEASQKARADCSARDTEERHPAPREGPEVAHPAEEGRSVHATSDAPSDSVGSAAAGGGHPQANAPCPAHAGTGRPFTGDAQQQAQAGNERVPCPHCGRHFGVKQAERHIAICKNAKAQPALAPLKRPPSRVVPAPPPKGSPSPPAAPEQERPREGGPSEEGAQPSGWDSDDDATSGSKASPPQPPQPQRQGDASPSLKSALEECSPPKDAEPSGWDDEDDQPAKRALDSSTPEGPSRAQQGDAPPSGWDSDDDNGGRVQHQAGKKAPLPALDFGPGGSKVPLVKAPLKLEFDMCKAHKPVPKKLAERLSRRSKKSAQKEGPPAEPPPSGWDSDDDKGKGSSSRKSPHKPADACGAPSHRPAKQLVGARQCPAPGPENAVGAAGGDGGPGGVDWRDLVGEVLGADCSGGSPGSAGGHELVPGFQCTGCDHQVLRVDGCVWLDDQVDYMFLRNNYPEVAKLRRQLKKQKGCCAYCCQCSSRSADAAADLADVAEGLRWRVIAAS